MDEARLKENARPLVRIAAADPDPLRARQLLKGLLAQNPFLAREAGLVLDTPAFVLRTMRPEDVSPLLRSLSPEVLAWVAQECADHPEAKALIERTIGRKKAAAAPPTEEVGGADGFHRALASAIDRGTIAFDSGLLFGVPVPCLGAVQPKEEGEALWRVLVLDPAGDRSTSYRFWALGPPGERVVFSIHLGERSLHDEPVTMPSSGIFAVEFSADRIQKLLPESDRLRSLILFAGIRDGARQLRAFRPFVVDADFGLTDGDLPLSMEVSHILFSGETLEFAPVIRERRSRFTGEGELFLRCVLCGSTVARLECEDHPEGVRVDLGGHAGPFQLSFRGLRSGRVASVTIPARGTPVQEGTSPDALSLAMPDAFLSSQEVEATIKLDDTGAVVYWTSPAGNAAHIVDDCLRIGTNFPVGDIGALKRASHFLFEEAFGRNSETVYTKGDCARGVMTLPVPQRPPGEYRLDVAFISRGRVARAWRTFTVLPALSRTLPVMLEEGDEVIGELETPADAQVTVRDQAGQELQPVSVNGVRRFRLAFSGGAPSEYEYELQAEGGPLHETLRPAYPTGSAIQKIEVLAPYLARRDSAARDPARAGADAMAGIGAGDDRPQAASPDDYGGDLGLHQAITRVAIHLWNYSVFCAEQSSSRLFAFGVLRSFGYPGLLMPETVGHLVEKLHSFHSEATGQFALWDGLPADAKVTDRVVRSLAIFRGKAHPAGTLVERSLAALPRDTRRWGNLAFLDQRFSANGRPSFVSLWESFWRSKKDPRTSEHWNAWFAELLEMLDGSRPQAPGIWAHAELEAMLLYAGALSESEKLSVHMRTERALRLGFLPALFNRLGITSFPTTQTQRRAITRPNPVAGPEENFMRLFASQGDTSLFGSTTGSVALLQALIGLHNLKMGDRLRFKAKEVPVQRWNASTTAAGFRILSPSVSWRMGEPQRLRIHVREAAAHLVVAVRAPSHSRLLFEDGAVHAGNHYVELPLRHRSEVSVRILPLMRGHAAMRVGMFSMYGQTQPEGLVQRIDVS